MHITESAIVSLWTTLESTISSETYPELGMLNID